MPRLLLTVRSVETVCHLFRIFRHFIPTLKYFLLRLPVCCCKGMCIHPGLAQHHCVALSCPPAQLLGSCFISALLHTLAALLFPCCPFTAVTFIRGRCFGLQPHGKHGGAQDQMSHHHTWTFTPTHLGQGDSSQSTDVCVSQTRQVTIC